MTEVERVKRQQRVAEVARVLNEAALQFTDDPPELIQLMAPFVFDWVDAQRAADADRIYQLSRDINDNRLFYEAEQAARSKANDEFLRTTTATVRVWMEAIEELRTEGTPAEKAAITRIDNKTKGLLVVKRSD